MEWFNIINNVPVNEVYPNKRLGSNQNKYLTPLILKIHPHKSGMFTYISDDTLNSFGEPEKNWTGFFKFLNTTSTNLLDENIGFIEIWMQLALAPTNDSAKMIIDLGTITEKIIANRKSIDFAPNQDFDFYTEDLNNNGTLDAIEDLGIDGVPDNEEPGWNPATNPDPSRDKYSWNQGQGLYDFPSFNGTEAMQIWPRAGESILKTWMATQY